MIKKSSRNIGLFCLLGTCILISLISIQIIGGIKNSNLEGNRNILTDKLSISPSFGSILINDDNPGGDYHDWNWWKTNYDWCTYNASEDTYYIKNVELSGGNRINIIDSDKNFIIENCKVSGSSNDGIKLENVENGKIINNNFSYNAENGIYLKKNSNNNEITANYVSHNSQNGIYVEGVLVIEDYWQLEFPFHIYNEYYYSCNYNNISHNTAEYNSINGIIIKGFDGSYTNKANIVEENTVGNNVNNGIYIIKGDDHTIDDNICSNNANNGICLTYSDKHTITNNLCSNNENNGIYFFNSDKNTVLNNEANGNGVSGIALSECDRNSQWNNELSSNTISNNKYGIYLYSSDYNYIGTGNIATGNTQYGIYLSDESKYNKVIGNTVNNNVLYDICYENDDCTSNTFEDNGVAAINLANPNAGTGGGLDFPFLSLIIFFGIICGFGGSVGYMQVTKNKRSRERDRVEKNIYDRSRTVLHHDEKQTSSNLNQVHNHDIKIIKPQLIAPYEFYCSKCDLKSVGYQVFCPTCGDRMRQPDLVLKPEALEQVSCVICHSATCDSCSQDMTGEESCYEECPYCGRSYHKHCWDKTIEVFGKCGFCLETPPPELMPKSVEMKTSAESD